MRTYHALSLAIASLGVFSTTAFAQEDVGWPSYSWMLPKTVIDLAVTYSLDECKLNQLKAPIYNFKISATMTSRAVADLAKGDPGLTDDHGWGIKSLDTNELPKDWADSNVAIATNAGTHILSSVSAHSTDETATIVGNVITGIVKLAGLFVGPLADKALLTEEKSLDKALLTEKYPGTEEPCLAADDPAIQLHADRDQVYALQRALADGSSQDSAQNVMVKVQALQNLMTKEQSDLTIDVKAIIDPGYISPNNTQVNPDLSPPAASEKPGPIKDSPKGLGWVGTVSPTPDKLKKILPKSFTDEHINQISESFRINVYLDFAHAQPKVNPKNGEYMQRPFESHAKALTYREPVYIPVVVWRGRPTDNPTKLWHQVLPTQMIAFAQYGILRWIPFDAKPFADNSFTVHFADDGEVTDGEDTGKSRIQNMTGLFSSAASGAYTIGNAVRTADSPATEAAELQGKADRIYNTKRLALCQADIGSCQSK